MKILYVDIEIGGHHQTYLKALMEIPGKDNVLVLPDRVEGLKAKQYVFSKMDFFNKKLVGYCRWIREIKKIIEIEKPDVIHFLYGDVFYKYFGLGLQGLKGKYKVINTVHALKKGKIGIISLRKILRMSSVGVVHTEAIYNEVKNAGIENVVHIEYPHFSSGYSIDQKIARQYFGLRNDTFVLGCIGGTRYDKGLDILLKALQNVIGNFELLVAGTEDAIKRSDIEKIAESYIGRVKLHLAFLTDEEFEMAIQAVDAIVLPYRKTFNGASGPLGEGVAKEKMIIGANHGSLGDIIEKNHLGYTFESENINSLTHCICKAMKGDFKYDDNAIKYEKLLSVNSFQKNYNGIYEA